MNQEKIGKFIQASRKEVGLTQAELAERLGITDRAVSKWETGKSMPDASIMLELCEILKINVNELLSGERLTMENYNKTAEENLLELKKREEVTNKKILGLEKYVGISASISFFVLIFVASYSNIAPALRILMISVGLILFIVGVLVCLTIEQGVGYYECPDCGYKYVPSYSKVLFAMHMGTTRKMRCPNCGKKSWQKKALTKY